MIPAAAPVSGNTCGNFTNICAQESTYLYRSVVFFHAANQAHYGDIAVLTVGGEGNGRQKRGATAIRERLWPDARVPYEIDPRYNGTFLLTSCLYSKPY